MRKLSAVGYPYGAIAVTAGRHCHTYLEDHTHGFIGVVELVCWRQCPTKGLFFWLIWLGVEVFFVTNLTNYFLYKDGHGVLKNTVFQCLSGVRGVYPWGARESTWVHYNVAAKQLVLYSDKALLETYLITCEYLLLI